MNRLDWTDIAMMMNAVQGAHECRVSLAATVDGEGHNGGMHLRIEATFATLPGSDLPKTVMVTGDWPSQKARSFEGLCYNLLWQLDYAITAAYEQMRLPAT